MPPASAGAALYRAPEGARKNLHRFLDMIDVDLAGPAARRDHYRRDVPVGDETADLPLTANLPRETS